MDGAIAPGWYDHPQFGLIRIIKKDGQWAYVCYSHDGGKALSRPRPVDPWVWALSEKNEKMPASDEDF